MDAADFDSRRADASDAEDIADAHRDSIRSLGPTVDPPHGVDDWQSGLTADLYRKAMEAGEVFFVATRRSQGRTIVLGFASDYATEGTRHGTSVYVRGAAARDDDCSNSTRPVTRTPGNADSTRPSMSCWRPTNAPKLASLVTLPVTRSPTL